jgi:uncharacterized protein YoxC
MIMNPTMATLLTTSVTVIAAIMVLVLIFLIPVLLQVRRTAHEAEKLIDSVRLQVAPERRESQTKLVPWQNIRAWEPFPMQKV